MPKMKSHSASKKRFKMTASGKVKYSKTFRRHILTKKTTKRKRNLRAPGYLFKSDAAKVHVLLPYA